ncbi:flagellin [Desulfurivibrio sp. D14AmB]|uniref:flagellin N-terminal helical domain-containing protein n=1 Tax=Desulfurivibrio sp. D14AmB TaxID=3374370 RepID=UPI00376F11C2
MRVTMQSIYSNILVNLNKLNTDINRVNQQISSGKQMSSISDNPVNLVNALGLRTNLSEIGQYRKNLSYGNTVITASENALVSMKDLVMRAKTLAIQQANAPLSPDNRQNAATEVKHLWEQAIILANSSVNGKYIFGGFRTTGYTPAEPAPFVQGARDGYFINGEPPAPLATSLTGTVDNSAIAAGDLAVNGTPTPVDIDPGAVINGLAMEKAANAVAALDGLDPEVSAKLTTLLHSTPFTAQTAGTGDPPQVDYDFTINGVAVNTISIIGEQSAAEQVDLFVEAINAVSGQTGVGAEAGNDANGGVTGGIVLRNLTAGDDSTIEINAFTRTEVEAGTGAVLSVAGDFADALSAAAGPANNTGEITLSSTSDPASAFTLTSPNHNDDTVFDTLGLGASAEEGTLLFGLRPLAGELLINGRPVSSQADGISTIYADASAAAKAAAINAGDYGVRAEIVPAGFTAAGPVQEGSLDPGDLVINGVEILVEQVGDLDSDNALVRAINARQEETGVVASRGENGRLILNAVDGRNLQVTTSAMGEQVTQLNNLVGQPSSQVHFGSVRLWSDQPFRLESRSEDDPAAALAALGLSAEGDDPSLLIVNTIQRDNDYVRYAGDRDNDISIKVGPQSTIEINKNGYDAVFDTGVFRILKELEDFLQGEKYTAVTGAAQAGDIHALLNSEDTGLELADRIVEGGGTFKVVIANHDSTPPSHTTTTIRVDPENDTLEDIAQRLNGINGLAATWTDTGHLRLESSDPQRYSFNLEQDTSGLLDAIGLRPDQIQASALQKSIAELEVLLNEQTNQISDFGARANRIETQNNIYMNLEVATAENLSELEDTDLIKALMEMQAKEVAYQAALSAAAKTMQLSLVNFL